MPSLTIERTFSVAAPPERVWTCLTDPTLVVTCLPGAALESSSDDGRVHEGTVTVKLGTLHVSYRGRAEFIEVDPERRRLGVKAKGREKTGTGSADMSMQAQVTPSSDGSEVSIEASVNVTGKLVTLGRGMIGVVSEQLVTDFADNLCAKVSGPAGGSAGDDSSDSGAGPDAATDSGVDSPATTDSGSASAEPGRAQAAASGAPRPANALSIVFRAVWARLKRLFGSD